MRNSIYFTGCFAIIMVICIAIAFDALLALGVMALWNWLAPLFWNTAPILEYLFYCQLLLHHLEVRIIKFLIL